MKTQSTRSRAGADLSDVRNPIQLASHAPGYVYSSQEVYEREKRLVFMKDWLMVGRAEEVQAPGQYFTMDVLGEPVLICRDQKGAVNAFVNACLHRGAEVASGSGQARAFVCPYHGWTYDLAGKLRSAPGMAGVDQFDPAKCQLRRLSLGEWAGNLFISFDPDPIPFSSYIAEFEKDFAFLKLENCRLGRRRVRELDCNWKLVIENLMDFMHVPVLHAKTLGAPGFFWDDDKVSLKADGGLSIFYTSAPSVAGGQTLFGKLPWLADRDNTFASIGIRPPNLVMFGRIDTIRPMTIWPVGPNRCTWISYNLYAPEVVEDPAFKEKEKAYDQFQDALFAEDYSMILGLQRVMSTHSFRPGRMALMEKPIHNFLNAHLDRVLADGPSPKHPTFAINSAPSGQHDGGAR